MPNILGWVEGFSHCLLGATGVQALQRNDTSLFEAELVYGAVRRLKSSTEKNLEPGLVPVAFASKRIEERSHEIKTTTTKS